VKDKRRTRNNNLEFLIGCRGFPDPKDDTWEPLDHLSGSEHMIREFNEQWEKDYVRKTVETLEDQTVRRKSAVDKNAQRDNIDEAMGEGGTDEEEDGESEFRRGLCRRGRPASSVHASPTGVQRHRTSDVVEVAPARVSRLGPND
jgi:hypothetical protein